MILALLVTVIGPSGVLRPASSAAQPVKPAVVAMAFTPDGAGYWLVGSDGGVFSYGDADFHGSLGGRRLSAPITGIAATPDGGGYWLVGADGGVFSFGDAVFHGSLGGHRLAAPVAGIAATPDGGGYWLVGRDGGVFSFGDAVFHGGLAGQKLAAPITGIAATRDGGGYWLVGSDGGVFSFGDAPFHGSLGGQGTAAAVTALSATPSGGYALVTTTGTTYSYGTGAPSTTSGGTALGMSAPSLLGYSPTQQAAALSAMHAIGLRWVRVDVDWSWVQAGGPSSFDWAASDSVVAAAAAAGINVDLIIDNTPTWAAAAGSPAHSFTQPTSAATYATFAGQVAAHYGPMGVHTYEIWNEPNIQQFWLPAPNPALYTAMLRYSYATIKAAQPSATVISGGLSPSTSDGTNISPIDFLYGLYADGAGGSFDEVGFHGYSYPALADTYESWSGWSQMSQTTPSIRSVMAANGDSAKQVWITEVGAPSAGPDGVGTAAQAQEITQVVTAAKSTPWIGGLFIYTYQDSANNDDYFGLLNADGSQKPAWAALVAALG